MWRVCVFVCVWQASSGTRDKICLSLHTETQRLVAISSDLQNVWTLYNQRAGLRSRKPMPADSVPPSLYSICTSVPIFFSDLGSSNNQVSDCITHTRPSSWLVSVFCNYCGAYLSGCWTERVSFQRGSVSRSTAALLLLCAQHPQTCVAVNTNLTPHWFMFSWLEGRIILVAIRESIYNPVLSLEKTWLASEANKQTVYTEEACNQ